MDLDIFVVHRTNMPTNCTPALRNIGFGGGVAYIYIYIQKIFALTPELTSCQVVSKLVKAHDQTSRVAFGVSCSGGLVER